MKQQWSRIDLVRLRKMLQQTYLTDPATGDLSKVFDQLDDYLGKIDVILAPVNGVTNYVLDRTERYAKPA